MEKLTGGTNILISAGNYGTNYGQFELDSISVGLSSGNKVRAITINHSNQYVGINDTTPTYTLDVNGTFRSIGLSRLDSGVRIGGGGQNYAIRTFDTQFTNGVANQKFDVYWGNNIAFWGWLEISLTATYSNQNSPGVVTKRFYVGLNPSNAIYMNEARYSDVGGATPDNFAISDVTWDSTNSRYRIQIVHRVSTGNTVRGVIKVFGGASSQVDNMMNNFALTSVYTTDTTAFAKPVIQLQAPNDNAWVNGGYLGIGTATPQVSIHSYKSTNSFFNGLNIENPNTGSSASAGLYLTAQNTLDVRILNNSSGDFGYINTSGTLYTGLAHAGGMCLVAKSGKVGIGTTDPERPLHVIGGIHLNNASVLSWDAADGNLRNTMYVDSGDDLIIGDTNFDDIYFSTGQKTKTVVIKQTTGNVGIGTDAPAATLDVRRISAAASEWTAAFCSDNQTLATARAHDSVLIQASDVPCLKIYEAASTPQVATLAVGDGNATLASSNTLRFYVNGSNTGDGYNGMGGTLAMHIKTDGKVGIGTGAPDEKLEVYDGYLKITDAVPTMVFERQSDALKGYITSNVGYFQFSYNTKDGDGYIKMDVNTSGGSAITHEGNGYLRLGANSVSDQLVLAANGNVGIGTAANLEKLTTYSATSVTTGPTTAIKCLGTHAVVGGGAGIFLKSTTSHASDRYGAQIGVIRRAENNGSCDLLFKLENTAANALTERMRILGDGNVGIGTTNPGTTLEVNGRTMVGISPNDNNGNSDFSVGVGGSGSTIALYTGHIFMGGVDTMNWYFKLSYSGGSSRLYSWANDIYISAGWNGTSASHDVVLSAATSNNTPAEYLRCDGSTGKVYFSKPAYFGTAVYDKNNSYGTSGQVLSTTGSGGVDWVDAGGGKRYGYRSYGGDRVGCFKWNYHSIYNP